MRSSSFSGSLVCFSTCRQVRCICMSEHHLWPGALLQCSIRTSFDTSSFFKATILCASLGHPYRETQIVLTARQQVRGDESVSWTGSGGALGGTLIQLNTIQRHCRARPREPREAVGHLKLQDVKGLSRSCERRAEPLRAASRPAAIRRPAH